MRRLTIITLAAATCAFASPGASQVLEIGDDGAVTTYAVPSIHTSRTRSGYTLLHANPIYR